MDNKNNFKNTCVFAVCGALSVTLLGLSALSFARTAYAADNTTSLTVQVDDGLYNGLLALSNTSESDVQNNVQDLHVLINGKEYPVIENEDGQFVVQNVEITEPSGTKIAETDVPLADAIESSKITIDANGNKVYHIVWGDTLSELALEFDNTVEVLADYNHIANPDLIYAEDDLYLPD